MSSRTLLVEDEPGLVLTIDDLLSAEGYEVDTAQDGNTGLAKAKTGQFDLILLDPPYGAGRVRDALDRAGRMLSAGGVLVLERATRQDPDIPPTLVRVRDVASGDSTLTMFTTAGDTTASERS